MAVLRRAAALVATGGVIVAGATLLPRLSEAAPSASPAAPPARVQVAVVGDSLIRQSTPRIKASLVGLGYDERVASHPGQSLSSEAIRTELDSVEGRPGDVVVIATATNDAVEAAKQAPVTGPDQARAAYRQLLSRTIDRFNERCVVVVNARDASNPIYYPEQAAVLDRDIETVAASRANTVVVDWASISRSHTDDWFVADQEHFGADPTSSDATRPGAQAYADAIADAVSRCAGSR